jgi:solute carrier family 15 (peptide/histidine transporter), member 3/4
MYVLFTVLIVMTNIANIPMILNLVSYLHGTMHMGIKDASTNFFGAICFFSFLLGAFISDSYIKRFYTVLVFAPIEILVIIFPLTMFVNIVSTCKTVVPCNEQGYILLACQAHFASLHPPPCDIINNPNEIVHW